jgi:Fic family protein
MKQANTKPKGATSYKETAFGILPRIKLLQLELEGTKKGLEYIYNLVNKNEVGSITSGLICKLHNTSFGWIFPAWAGKYRTIQVTFSGKEAPPYYQIPELIINLCNDVSERQNNLPSSKQETFITEAVTFLAWFQHRFVFIHPFQDYNGRMARMLTILLLLRLNLPPIELKAETKADRRRYLTALQKADNGDFLPLENLVSQALTEALDHVLK